MSDVARCTSRRSGLTLVEMLVAVAIMAIILAVMLPALTQARAEGHRAGCGKHLLDLGRALEGHMADHDGRLPVARSLAPPVISVTHRPPLTVALVGQLRATTTAFHCPGDMGTLYTACGMSYFYDTFLSGVRPAALEEAGRSLDRIPILWDADQDVFRTRRGELVVPRFHDYRQALFADLRAGEVDDSRTMMW